MNNRIHILVICRHNSGRSMMAQAYLKQLGGDAVLVESAGLEPADRVNPLVVQVMQEEGIDLSDARPQSVFTLFKEGRLFNHVITTCAETENQCPVFPGITTRWHQPFPDPAKVDGSETEKLAAVRRIRDAIRQRFQSPGPGDFDLAALVAKTKK